MVEILPDLVVLLLWALALALALSMRAFVQATQIIVHATVGKIPLVGGFFSAAFDAIAAPVTRVLEAQIHFCDAKIGALWHLNAKFLSWFIEANKELGTAVWSLGKGLYRFASKDYLSMLVHRLQAAIRAVEHAGGVALHETVVINKKADAALAHNVLPRLRSLEHEAEVVLPHDIAALRHRARTLENEYAKLNHWLRTHPWTAVTTAFVGAVAIALSRLGIDWMRCGTWRRLGPRVCGGLGNLLLDLLNGVIDVLVIADLCQITKLMIDAAESSLVQDGLKGLIAGVDELLICQGVDLPAPLTGYSTGLPPAQAFALLPAA